MYPSSFRKDRLGPVAGVDRIGLAPTLGQPVEPFGADDADDVGEVLPPRAGSTLYRDQAVQFGEPDRPLGERMADQRIMQTGKLKKWLDERGFGFIKQDGSGPDLAVQPRPAPSPGRLYLLRRMGAGSRSAGPLRVI